MLIVLQRYKDERLKARKKDVGEVENEKFRIINKKKRTASAPCVSVMFSNCPPVVLSLPACGFIIVRLWFFSECGEVKEEDDEEPQDDSEQENEQARGVA